MKIIFCLSYLEVPDTLTLIEKSKNEEFVVVTYNSNLRKLFSTFYGEDRIFFFENQIPILSKSPFRLINNLLAISKLKRRTWEKFRAYKNCEVYFSAVDFCEFEAWLVTKLSKSNRVYYKPEVSIDHLKTKYTVYSFIYILVNRVVYRIQLRPLWNGKNYCFAIGKDFLKRTNATKYEVHIDKDVLNNIIKSHFDLDHKEILLLVGGPIEEGNVDEGEYITKMDTLIDFLKEKHGLENLAIKVHPGYLKVYSKENEIETIPSFIPANLIFHFFKVVIAYNTAALFEAANENRIAISLLKYMKPTDDNVCRSYINYLNSNAKNSVYFPQSINGIEEILKRVYAISK